MYLSVSYLIIQMQFHCSIDIIFVSKSYGTYYLIDNIQIFQIIKFHFLYNARIVKSKYPFRYVRFNRNQILNKNMFNFMISWKQLFKFAYSNSTEKYYFMYVYKIYFIHSYGMERNGLVLWGF